MRPRKIGAIGIMAILLAAFFFLPVESYAQAVNLPYGPQVRIQCGSQTSQITSATWTVTTTYTETINEGSGPQTECIAAGVYPPISLNGYGSLSYKLFGLGASPYPQSIIARAGNQSVLLYFERGQAVAAELLGFFLSGPEVIDPPGVVQVVNPAFQFAANGLLNFSAAVKNVGHSVISSAVVWLDTPGLDSNHTMNGITWMQALPIGDCSSPLQGGLEPGRICTASQLVNRPRGGDLDYAVEVTGSVNGINFIYRQGFQQTLPPVGIGSAWVGAFIQGLNHARSRPLAANATLDGFAAERFRTASSQPDISDYGFAADANSWFGPRGGARVSEELLFPGGFALSPRGYLMTLQANAPGHWAGLTNLNYTQFGYYVGEAPYFTVSANCPVTEVLGSGVNITQYFESYGCQVTPVAELTWLVIILAP